MTFAIPNLNWLEYQGDPQNLYDQRIVNFSTDLNWTFGASGSIVNPGAAQGQSSQVADGVNIDNTQSKQPVTVTVGGGFSEVVSAYSKSTVQLGGTAPYVKISGAAGNSCTATFYKGVFPGAINGQNPYGAALQAVSAFVPTGSIALYAQLVAPDGYLLCDGAAYSRTQYSTLFNVIGTTFGPGDGSTTFNVPDFRGVFPRGYDSGRGQDPGRAFGSYQADNIANHAHNIPFGLGGNGANVFALYGADGRSFTGDDPGQTSVSYTYPAVSSLNSGSTTTRLARASASYYYGSANQDTRPKNLAITFMIKT